MSGPFVFKEVIGPRELMGKMGGAKGVRVVLRGIRATGDPATEDACERGLLRWLARGDELYLLRDTISTNPVLSAVMLKPTTKFGTVDVATGQIRLTVANYAIMQFWMLELGETLVDRSDNTHALFRDFCRAEATARREKVWYWATKRE